MNTAKQSFTILGVTTNPDVPATSADWDSIQGDGACVSSAISEHGYRGYASPVRTAILAALAAAGHKPTEGEKDAPFVKRLREAGVNVNQIAQSAADAVSFVETMKGGSRADVGKDYLDQAQSVITRWENGSSTVDAFVAKMRTLVPDASVPDPTDVTAIAKTIRAFRKAQADADLG